MTNFKKVLVCGALLVGVSGINVSSTFAKSNDVPQFSHKLVEDNPESLAEANKVLEKYADEIPEYFPSPSK
ncbi:hypothetical protein GFV16_11415 [Bacillus megaterium]|uniref:hypothetical protein n=1 Tax=Priestia megaterium TaxID=1404 RepID=UPI0012930AEE|nr:hypothetical protein [Priestia megaterium]MQR86520.1 hypothetical protein [Priestia megaterium]